MKTLEVPKVKINTRAGELGLRVARSNLVQISGKFEFEGKTYPFSLRLIRGADGWRCTEAGMERFSDMLVRAFEEWSDKHPRILEMANHIHRHNVEAWNILGKHRPKDKI